jgi:hypothetical protein
MAFAPCLVWEPQDSERRGRSHSSLGIIFNDKPALARYQAPLPD